MTYFGINHLFQHQRYGASMMLSFLTLCAQQRHSLGAYTLIAVESKADVIDFYEQFGFSAYGKPNNRATTFLGLYVEEIDFVLASYSETAT